MLPPFKTMFEVGETVSLLLALTLANRFYHDAVKQVRVNTMAQIMHQTSQHNTFLLFLSEKLIAAHLRKFCDGLVLLEKVVHHFAAQVGSSYTVFKSVMSCTGKHVVVGPQLV